MRNTPGKDSPVFETPYGRVGIIICADRTEPAIVQRICTAGADFLICPSGGMFGPRNNDPIVQARSRENQIYILFTHPADNRILNGVTREAILEIARQLGVRMLHQPVTLAEAMAADEAFVTGTLSEIMPAVSIDGKPVGKGKVGPVTLKLRAAFRELTAKECS